MTRLTDDATLDALVNGELGEDELGFLAALAEGDAEAEAELEAVRPLGDDARARIADGIVASMAAAPAEALEAAPTPSPAAMPAPGRGSGGRRPWVLGAAAVVLAAAVALVVVPSQPELPSFELEVSGQRSGSRATPSVASTDTVELAPEGTLEVILRPTQPTAVVGALFLERGDRLLPIDEVPQRASNGTLRWRVPAEVIGTAGETAAVIVTYDTAAPTEADARERLDARDPRARRIRVQVGATAP